MAMGNAELVRSSFDAFLRGDWHALSDVLDPGVEWLWHEPGDWDCHDRRSAGHAVRAQREGVVTGLEAVVEVGDRVFVEVTGPRLQEWELPGGRACMVVTVRDGRIVRMQDYPDARSRARRLAPPSEAPSRKPSILDGIFLP
jgi:ketosteroid isomerase-like protein